MKLDVKVGDEVDANVRVKAFGGGQYFLRKLTFTIDGFEENGLLRGKTIEDGSIAIFPFTSIVAVNGMAAARYTISTTKEGRKEIPEDSLD